MAWVESIQKEIHFMEDHLLNNITIEQIARGSKRISLSFSANISRF
jgi:predicted DNA-binding protein